MFPDQEDLTEPEHAAAPTQSLGAHPSLKLPIDNAPALSPWLLSDLRHQPRAGCMKTSPEPSRLRDSQTLHSRRNLAGRSRDRVTHGA